MEAVRLFKSLDRNQRNTFLACFLGWALDAFDFFLLTFVIVPMAGDFGTSIAELSYAITLTLAMRPVGAFIFGLLGDRFGRRMPLMIDIIFYSLMELLTAFSPNYTWLLIFRALYGIGMGGEWGLGASLAMETLPTAARGRISILRMARTLRRGSAARISCAVHPCTSARIAGLAATAARDDSFLERSCDGTKTALGSLAVRHFVDDGVQRHVAWNPGHVSNFSR